MGEIDFLMHEQKNACIATVASFAQRHGSVILAITLRSVIYKGKKRLVPNEWKPSQSQRWMMGWGSRLVPGGG